MIEWGRWRQHRDPSDLAAAEIEREAIRYAIDCASEDLASMYTALELDESTEVVESWSDRAWDGLRERLDDEQMIYAVVMLLEDFTNSRSRAMLKALGDDL